MSNRSSGGPAHSHFALTGRSRHIDSRVDPARKDLADIRLADRVFAPHYAAAVLRVATAHTPLLSAGASDAAPLSELLPGDGFEMLEETSSYAWGVSRADGAVGYVAVGALGGSEAAPAPHANGATSDIATAAEKLIGVPARAGGRSAAGVDAGGFVFLAAHMAGTDAPRFVDLQAERLGEPLPADAPAQRGDLIFFADDAAILADADETIHVGAEQVLREPLAELVARHGAIVARRRLA